MSRDNSQNQGEIVLDARNITMQFGGLKAVDSFNLQLRKGELVGLIGPNGAGKTTCFNMLTGVYQPTSGEVMICDKVITGLKPHRSKIERRLAEKKDNSVHCSQLPIKVGRASLEELRIHTVEKSISNEQTTKH